MKSSSFKSCFTQCFVPIMMAGVLLISGCQAQTPTPALALSTPSPKVVRVLPTLIPSATATPAVTQTATITPTPTATPCAEPTGQVISVQFRSPILGEPIPARVYLPPCYADAPLEGYPLLVMLHGQRGEQTTWEKLGLTAAADQLIAAGEIPRLVMVMPFEHDMWSEAWDSLYPLALINDMLPQINEQFHVNPLPRFRALGGYSRGANWAVRIGFTKPGLFGAIGAHSYPTFSGDTNQISEWVEALPQDQHPRLLLDTGETDLYLPFTKAFQAELDRIAYPHDYRLQPGAHDYDYWETYAADYLRWYAEGWGEFQ